MQVEAPIDVQKTAILGNDIEKRLIASGRFEFHKEGAFPHFTMKSDKDKCFIIDISTIAKPPRKSSHYYTIGFRIPDSFREKYKEYLSDENRQQHYLLQNAISSAMSRYMIMEAVHVKDRSKASLEVSKRIVMEIRLSAMTFKSNYPKLLKVMEEKVANYKKQMT